MKSLTMKLNKIIFFLNDWNRLEFIFFCFACETFHAVVAVAAVVAVVLSLLLRLDEEFDFGGYRFVSPSYFSEVFEVMEAASRTGFVASPPPD